MVKSSEPQPTSTVLLDEYLATGDARLLPELYASTASRALKHFGERWYASKTPEARAMLLAYVDDGCDRAHHRALVKKLFKLAEAAGDDELMGHFMVAFDRLVRRKLVDQPWYDYQSKQSTTRKVLVPDGALPPARLGAERAGRFSRLTRRYLARRAFRYFRRFGRKDPLRYGRAMRAALALYRDEHLAKPENLLDAWGLMHALFHGSPALDRHPKGIRVAHGHTLAELAPAPIHPAAWQGCFDELLALLARARSRTVRTWTLTLLARDYARELDALPLAQLLAWMKSPHEELLEFAAPRLRASSALASLPIETWLELLAIENPAAIAVVCELVAAHVTPARLSLVQCVELARARVASVAELGLAWAREKPVRTADELRLAARVAGAGAPLVRRAGVDWVVALLAQREAALPEVLRELLDSRFDDARARALALLASDARYGDELTLWAALAESPHDDVRGALLARMDAWQARFAPEALRHVWASALLAIRRGSRAKARVLRQIAERAVARPEEAAALLPLLRVGLRSVRAPERRAALGAVARAARANRALREQLARAVPELFLFDDGAAA